MMYLYTVALFYFEVRVMELSDVLNRLGLGECTSLLVPPQPPPAR